MDRMPSWATSAGVAALVVADVALISLAVLHARDDSAAGPPTPSDGPAARAADDKRRSQLAAGRVLLDVAADGTVLRAARGSCRSRTGSPVRTAVEVSTDGGRSFGSAALDPPVVDVLAVVARSVVDLTVVGVDETCLKAIYTSSDGGLTWNMSLGTGGAWHLARVERNRVHAPSGPAGVGCDVRAVSAYMRSGARALCVDGVLRGTDDGGTTWVALGSLPGAIDISYQNLQDGWALAATIDCPVAVLRTGDGGAVWEPTGCVRARGQPQAIAVTRQLVAVHVGGQLLTSTDGGTTFAKP